MNKKMFGVLKRAFVAFVVVALFCFLPFVKISGEDEFSLIFNAFVGAKGKYQGVIVVWNVDSFESGTAPKTKYLNSVARDFEKKNKGTYILVRNVTEYECKSLLEQGEKPDLFSCSYSLADDLKNYVQPYSSEKDINIEKNLLNAGKLNDELYALAWCRGIYVLISSSEKLEKAGRSFENGVKLSDIALKAGFETTKKGKTTITSSLVFGANGKLLPQKAFSSYTGNGLENLSAVCLNENSFAQSQYSAYANFVAGGSTILLGSQRDVCRMEGRLASGKMTDILYQPLYSETDLVQFCLLAKCDDKTKKESAEDFAKLLACEKQQSKISGIGMIPVISGLNPYSEGIMQHIVAEINGNYKVFSFFD